MQMRYMCACDLTVLVFYFSPAGLGYFWLMAILVTKSAFMSPIGPMLLQTTDEALISVKFASTLPEDANTGPTGHEILDSAKIQLGQYFANERKVFDLPLLPSGTAFQMKVWDYLRQIPYGRTTSYSAIAKAIGSSLTIRAVGAANGRNPIAVIIPCHRVIASDGKLTGYAWGVDKKKFLLDLESPVKQMTLF